MPAGTSRTLSRLKRLIQDIRRHSLWLVLGIHRGGVWIALQGITDRRASGYTGSS
jgi:hypothetical protein